MLCVNCSREGLRFSRTQQVFSIQGAEGGQTNVEVDGDEGISTYIADDGTRNARIYDAAFPHADGLRPYSYGLQACELTVRIVGEHWKKSFCAETPGCEVSR